MKTKLFIISFLLLAAGALNARVRTVDNNTITGGAPNNALRYTNLQIAIDSAQVGDTIYVVGSPNTYTSYGEKTFNNGNIYITTQITLIGAGYAVTGTQSNYPSYISYCYLDSIAYKNQVSGTKILGMDFYQFSNSDGPINNIDMERCYIANWLYVDGSNWTIFNNNIYAINVENESNILIQNNFVGNVCNSNQATVTVDHNNFTLNEWAIGYNGSMTNTTITNNVFYFCNPEPNNNNVTNCTFSNNLTCYLPAVNLNTFANNTDLNNVSTTGPVFADGTIPATYTSQNQWIYNWTAYNGSNTADATGANDGTAIGVYGGSHPMPNMTGATRIPQMTLLMNLGSVVPVGDSLKVNFKARIQQ
ncbi:MAG: hypothetical protein ACLQQ4_18580 [Bacteroidia bacterium]